MTSDRFENTMHDWLTDRAAGNAPDRLHANAMAVIGKRRQRAGWWARLRAGAVDAPTIGGLQAGTAARIFAVLVLTLLVGLALGFAVGSRPALVPIPTQSPQPTTGPTPPAWTLSDPVLTTTFVEPFSYRLPSADEFRLVMEERDLVGFGYGTGPLTGPDAELATSDYGYFMSKSPREIAVFAVSPQRAGGSAGFLEMVLGQGAGTVPVTRTILDGRRALTTSFSSCGDTCSEDVHYQGLPSRQSKHIAAGVSSRMIAFDVGGQTIVIDIWAKDDAEFDAWLPKATQFVESIHFAEPLGDSGWVSTRSMSDERIGHSATLLDDGTVLVAGGGDMYDPLATAEIYDPATRTWRSTGEMHEARANHTATLLSDGRVLVMGGDGFDTGEEGFDATLQSAELYDPSTGMWTETGSMLYQRSRAFAVLLDDGNVLVGGGEFQETSSELYDPSTGLWTQAADMSSYRSGATATLLDDGRVFVTGGYPAGLISLETTELYDPSSRTWTAGAPMSVKRNDVHTATLLSDGRVLVAGAPDWEPLSGGAAVYDPTTNAWSQTGPMIFREGKHAAALLDDGRVLVSGGADRTQTEFSNGSTTVTETAVDTVQLYDPLTNSWSAAETLNEPRADGVALVLQDGNVLLVGGVSESQQMLSSAELYQFGDQP